MIYSQVKIDDILTSEDISFDSIFFVPLTALKFVAVLSKHLLMFFGLRQSSENVRKRSSGIRTNFGKSSEIFGKSPKTSFCIMNILYNKKKITWSLGNIFSC